MTRICITGGPKTGKTTLAEQLACDRDVQWWKQHPSTLLPPELVRHTDDLIHLGWSEASQHVADEWLTQTGPWIIEGVAVVRALRKWREVHPGEAPPVDRVIRLITPHVTLVKGQAAMAKGEETVWVEVEPWLLEHGVAIEMPHAWSADGPGGPLCIRCGTWMAHDDGKPCQAAMAKGEETV